MFGLLHTLSKEQKADWPVHLPSLVFAYNATPHLTTGFQPYQLMFGRKAPTPCDNWLGLGKYDGFKNTMGRPNGGETFGRQQKGDEKHQSHCSQKQKNCRGGQTSIYSRVTRYSFGIIPREGTKSRTITNQTYLK